MANIEPNNGPASVNNPSHPQRTALVSGFVLIVAAVVLFWVQERSVIRTCLDLAGQNYNICFGGMGTDEIDIEFDDNFKNKINEILAKNASNNEIIYGLWAALVGGAAALLCVMALPADQLQFTGRFERSGGSIRVGGAVGVFLLFAAAGGWLAYTKAPGIERETIKDQAMVALLTAQERLSENLSGLKMELNEKNLQHRNLILNLSNKTNDFALSILNNKYFSQMNGRFEIDCESDQTEIQRQFLKVDFPGLTTNSAGFENGLFGIPLENLLQQASPLESELEEDSEMPVSRLEIKLRNAKRTYNEYMLAEIKFRVFRSMESPTARRVRMDTKIIAKNVADYCGSLDPSAAPLPKSVEADPLARPGSG